MGSKWKLESQTLFAIGVCFILIPMLQDFFISRLINGKMLLMVMGIIALFKAMKELNSGD